MSCAARKERQLVLNNFGEHMIIIFRGYYCVLRILTSWVYSSNSDRNITHECGDPVTDPRTSYTSTISIPMSLNMSRAFCGHKSSALRLLLVMSNPNARLEMQVLM